MWKDNAVYREDLQRIVADRNIPWQELDGKTVLVTGATGLIGSTLVNALLYYGEKTASPPRVLAFVRNEEKARCLYREQLAAHSLYLSFVVGDICAPAAVPGPVDYIIHAASETANMLELAREKQVKAFLYLSSMEAYGSPTEEKILTEDAPACFNSMAVRSCYPESKRMCEMLTAAYASEYRVPGRVVRLAQTFGPGIAPDDVRVFAAFARKALAGEDIELATRGDSKRMYLYTADAARAILTILLMGEPGCCYNAANPDTYCSIYEMAQMVSRQFSDGQTKILFSSDRSAAEKYPPGHRLKLDVTKLTALGWRPSTGLEEMYSRMIAGMQAEKNRV